MPPLTGIPVPEVRGAETIPYAASATWGYMHTHSQGASIQYQIIDWWPNLEIGGLFSCGSGTNTLHTNVCTQATAQIKKKLMMTMTSWASDETTTFNPSGFAGCDLSAVSGGPSSTVSATCPAVSAFNSRTCMSGVVSSLDSSTGFGTTGTVTFEPGFWTRVTLANDMDSSYDRGYVWVLIDSPFGLANEYVDDPNIMRNFLNTLNIVLKTGGWDYAYPEPLVASPTPSFLPTAGIPTWDTTLLC